MTPTRSGSVPFERQWAPLDALRARLIRALGAPGRRLVVDRELRVGLGATLAVGVALLGASTLPMWMLALGPILLGVPHVLGTIEHAQRRM